MKTTDEIQPKIGENWYVSLGGGVALSKIHLIRITDRIVIYKNLGTFSTETIYKRENLEFVEKIQEHGA